MKRLPVLVAALALVALVGGFVAYLAVGTGAPAFSVDGHTVSQSDVDGELRALADNAAFVKAIKQSGSTPLVAHPGSIDARYTAGWLSLRVLQVFVDDAVTRRHLTVTAADRTQAEGLAVNLLGSEAVLRTLPSSVRTNLRTRFARIVAVRDDDLTRQAAQLRTAALADVPVAALRGPHPRGQPGRGARPPGAARGRRRLRHARPAALDRRGVRGAGR